MSKFVKYVLGKRDEGIAKHCVKELLRHGFRYQYIEVEDESGDWIFEYEWEGKKYQTIQGEDELGFHQEDQSEGFQKMLKFQALWEEADDSSSQRVILRDILDSEAACYLPVMLHFSEIVDTWTAIYGKED